MKRILFVALFMCSCTSSEPMHQPPDAGAPMQVGDGGSDPMTPDAGGPMAACGNGVEEAAEVCLQPADSLALGPVEILEAAIDVIVVQPPNGAPSVATMDGALVNVLDGGSALQVAVGDYDNDGSLDIVILGADGTIRVHDGGDAFASAVDGASQDRRSIAVGAIGSTGFDIVTAKGETVEIFHLESIGATVSVDIASGARGTFVGILDPNEDMLADIIVGGVQFTDGVAIDSFFQSQGADVLDGPVQASKVRCPGTCEAIGMKVAELYGNAPDDVLLHVPGANEGDLHMYIGGGQVNEFSNPIGIPVRDVDDFEVGNVVGQQRPDVVVTSNCKLLVVPGVSLSAAPMPGVPFGDPIEIQAPVGHCAQAVAVVDLDGDGRDEVLTGGYESDVVVVYKHLW